MTLVGDVGNVGVVDVSGTDFPSKRFEVDAVVPFTCPFDSCEASEYPR